MNYDAKQRKLEKEAEYAKKNLIQKPLKFNLKTESDLIEWVESLKTPYQTYVKRLIRDDMNKKSRKLHKCFLSVDSYLKIEEL